jgi:hypothetical protein
VSKHPGRPLGETPRSILAHALTQHLIHYYPLTPGSTSAPPQFLSTTVPECPICTQLLDCPLELGCGTIICLGCCTSWIQFHHPPLSCPCCYDSLGSKHIRSPPPLVVTLLEGLLLYCVRGCGKIVRVGQYGEHLKGACHSHYHQLVDSPSKATLCDVLSRPSTSPATPAEVRVAGHLVRKILDQGDAKGVFNIPRRGKVSKLD